MKKLKFLLGGQPFRSTDFEVIQNASIDAAREILNRATQELTLLSGADYDPLAGYDPAESFTIPAGYVWDQSEICRIPEATFSYDASKQVYLRKLVAESSEREVGGTPQHVMTETTWEPVYVTSPAPGDVLLTSVPKLVLLTDRSLVMEQDSRAIGLGSGFTPSLGAGLYSFRNGCGERMIVCHFTATSPQGTIAVVDPDMRPEFDRIGFFRSGNALGALTLRTTGAVEVYGASTSAANVIQFTYNVLQGLTI